MFATFVVQRVLVCSCPSLLPSFLFHAQQLLDLLDLLELLEHLERLLELLLGVDTGIDLRRWREIGLTLA